MEHTIFDREVFLHGSLQIVVARNIRARKRSIRGNYIVRCDLGTTTTIVERMLSASVRKSEAVALCHPMMAVGIASVVDSSTSRPASCDRGTPCCGRDPGHDSVYSVSSGASAGL